MSVRHGSQTWTAETGGKWGDGTEAQYYTPLDRHGLSNAHVCSTGDLTITARREKYRGNAFTSARLKTVHAQRFGRVDVVARLDHEQPGVWPAIWLLGEPPDWPACGELDVMEWLGQPGANPRAHLHSRPEPDLGFELPVNVTEWHTYGVEWRPELIRFSVDGVEHGHTTPDDYGAGWDCFATPQRLIVNIAINGTHQWMPQPAPDFEHASMYVRSVKWTP